MEISDLKNTNEYKKFTALQSKLACNGDNLIPISPSTVFTCTFLVLGKYDYPINHESYISSNFMFRDEFQNKNELIDKLIYLMDLTIETNAFYTPRYIAGASLRLISTILFFNPDMELLKTINNLLAPLQIESNNELTTTFN